MSGNEYIFDRYQLYRLSSTRQLVLDNKDHVEKQASLYGGIDYNGSENTDSTENMISVYDKSTNRNVLVNTRSNGKGMKYLEGTLTEADSIYDN